MGRGHHTLRGVPARKWGLPALTDLDLLVRESKLFLTLKLRKSPSISHSLCVSFLLIRKGLEETHDLEERLERQTKMSCRCPGRVLFYIYISALLCSAPDLILRVCHWGPTFQTILCGYPKNQADLVFDEQPSPPRNFALSRTNLQSPDDKPLS